MEVCGNFKVFLVVKKNDKDMLELFEKVKKLVDVVNMKEFFVVKVEIFICVDIFFLFIIMLISVIVFEMRRIMERFGYFIRYKDCKICNFVLVFL